MDIEPDHCADYDTTDIVSQWLISAYHPYLAKNCPTEYLHFVQAFGHNAKSLSLYGHQFHPVISTV